MTAASTLNKAFRKWWKAQPGPGTFLIAALHDDGYVIVPTDFLQQIGEEVDRSLARSQENDHALYAYNTLGARIGALLNAVSEDR